jgi:hypothetical protein
MLRGLIQQPLLEADRLASQLGDSLARSVRQQLKRGRGTNERPQRMRYAAAGGSPEEARGERLKTRSMRRVLIGSAVESRRGAASPSLCPSRRPPQSVAACLSIVAGRILFRMGSKRSLQSTTSTAWRERL